MTTDVPGSHGDAQDDDQAVLLYLAAIETRRRAPDTLPQPDEAASNLAQADMVGGRGQEELETTMTEDDEAELEKQLAEATPGSSADVGRLEAGFVKAAAAYGARHRLTYEGWRQAGVEPEVLKRAGIKRPAD